MKLVEDFRNVPDVPLVLAVGAFDGVHRGHADVMDTAKKLADRLGAQSGVLRFYPHPAKVLYPESAPPLLGTEQTLARRLEEQDIHLQLRLPFTSEFAQLEPEDFLDQLLTRIPNLKGLVVGSNWRFGHRGRGDVSLLKTWGEAHRIMVVQTDDTVLEGTMISSTRIREAVQNGELEEASTLLGRPYSLTGTVQSGKQYGRKLGFPTANFTPEQECLPPAGVYAMLVTGAGTGSSIGAGYITHDPRLVEVHLLDFTGDLYGKHLEVALLSFQRPATPISDPDVLRKTIEQDVQAIRTAFC